MDAATFILADKPDWVRPLDVCLLVYLMSYEGTQGPKLADMAKASGVRQIVSVRESLKRMESHGWINITHYEGFGRPNLYTLNSDQLPGGQDAE